MFNPDIQKQLKATPDGVEHQFYASSREIHERLSNQAVGKGLTLIGFSSSGKSTRRLYRFVSCGHEQDISISNVHSDCFECKTCKDILYKQEAADHGLTLIGDAVEVRGSGTRRYRFDSCGHERDIKLDHVRVGNFRCQVCYEARLHSEAKDAGLEIVSASGLGTRYRVYNFISCGHKQDVRLDQVANGQIKCNTCFNARLTSEAASAGFTLLNVYASKPHCSLYECNVCGQSAEFARSNMRVSSIRCSKCLYNSRVDVANSAGVEFIGVSTTRKKHYRFLLPCGHEKEHTINYVKQKHIPCAVCGDTSWVHSSFVYLLMITDINGFSWLKIGHTRNVHSRIKQYGLAKGTEVGVLSTVECDTRTTAIKLEKEIIKKFAYHKLCDSLMMGYHTKSGHSECFNTECLPAVMEVFNNGGQFAI